MNSQEHSNPVGYYIQAEFKPVLDRALELCIGRFGDRIEAVTLGGSLARGEGVVGMSDADWFTFLKDEPSEDDVSWCMETQGKLEQAFPVVSEFGLNVNSIEHLRREGIWRFILRYNSLRIYGEDIIRKLEDEGLETPTPCLEMAKSRLEWIRTTFEEAQQTGWAPHSLPWPDDPVMVVRKMARHFVVLGGAYLLMADGAFRSFACNEVMTGLSDRYPQWGKTFSLAQAIMEDPLNAGVSASHFMSEITPYMQWLFDRVGNA